MSNNRQDAKESAIQKVLESLSSEHSKRAYERNLRAFFEWFRANGETAVTKPVVQRYAEDLKGAGISPATINQKLSAIRSLALHAANAGALQSDIADGVKRCTTIHQRL